MSDANRADFDGRFIESAPYTGLIDSLARISVISAVLSESANDLSAEDIKSICGTLDQALNDAVTFSLAKASEWDEISKEVMAGASLSRQRIQ
ncbi:hypothetical protein [Celeribacter baekdonensis]|uniref:Uncharacterized protein n=1 Tax=Celeribacter baekdonensis TaxID=875171 RepID=A0A2R4M161_9RHOB|nr:hypothetical protein [Celeribacter baekdonensis]AVW90901.1 hypothetical protein DA792_07215 [Celeribacter baekdonensis]